MNGDNPKNAGKSSFRNWLLISFLAGLWLLGAVSGMLFFNLLNFIHFRSKGHILVLVILIVGSIVLMAVSYVFFPREKDRNENRIGKDTHK